MFQTTGLAKWRPAQTHLEEHEARNKAARNVGALIIRIGFVGRLCYDYNKEPPKPYGGPTELNANQQVSLV